ncbi:roadblock/LC7 domain-containing protein [Acrocarpospora catenulata]|uniref:roadblock/LC7 domain-containing protein n=1 Tax=Acrocarpospora catenulata TaxID=2836182 RepID=UPI001BD924DD|nr:roadblock/LC7 domain-containing protein [Acrocarpospora catenulata]
MAELAKELDWLLDDLIRRTPGVRHAVVLSSDGLAMGGSQGLDREDTEHLAAIAAGSHSLAQGAGRRFGVGGVRQTIIELEGAFLFITAAGDGARLAVMTGPEADLGVVTYELTMLVKRVGEHLSTRPRAASGQVYGH